MAKTFKTTFVYNTLNHINIALLRAGVKMGKMTLLTVCGRKSGRPQTTPVMLFSQHGAWAALAGLFLRPGELGTQLACGG